MSYLLTKLNILQTICICLLIFMLLAVGGYCWASSVSNFTQTINPGTLYADIVNASYSSVGSPAFSMGSVESDLACQTSAGTFGSNTQRIYVKNPDAADGGWTLSLSGANPTDLWDSAGTDIDFNDPNASGCEDGADADGVGGQMTINPSIASLNTGICTSCSTNNISLGTASAFSQGVNDNITLMSGSSSADDIGDWYLTGVSVDQKIPAGQPSASDYNINLVLSIIAL